MPLPTQGNLNDLMTSYFSRVGQPLHVTLAQNVQVAGDAQAVPVNADILPEDAVAFVVKGRTLHQVTVTGTFSASINFEVTMDGETWVTANASPITTAGVYVYHPLLCENARLNVTAYTSGSINAELRSLLV